MKFFKAKESEGDMELGRCFNCEHFEYVGLNSKDDGDGFCSIRCEPIGEGNKRVTHSSHCELFKGTTNKTLDEYEKEILSFQRKQITNLKLSKEVLELLNNRRDQEATEKIVDFILAKEYIYSIRHDTKTEVYIYKEGIYIPNALTYIIEYCRGILGLAFNKNISYLVICKIQADTFIDQEKFFEEENINLVCVKNGILNLTTKTLGDFSPTYRFFNKLPITYDKEKDCPNIKKFFTSLFKDEKEVDVIQEIFGFLLYRDYFLEKSFMFLGYGRNGKGKTLLLMKSFLGNNNVAEMPLDELEKDIFAIGELFKKHANLCGDLSKTALKHTGKFKKLTGRDLILAARKYFSRIQFINYAKMIFAANDLPITYDLSLAFFNRWIIIEFPYTFLTQKEINELEKDELENVKLQDPNIIEKLISDDELSGLLNWGLEGLERIKEAKSFSYSPSTADTKEKWLRRSDSCNAFIMDCVEDDFESCIIKSEFKNRYKEYCKKHNLKISNDKAIKVALEQKGVGDDRKSVEEIQQHVWVGIRFKNEMVQNGSEPL